MPCPKIAPILLLALMTSLSLAAAELSIANESVTIRFEETSRCFSLVASSGQVVFQSEPIADASAQAQATDSNDPVFGQGKAIQVTDADGNQQQINVFRSLPFALVRSTRHNNRTKPETIRTHPTLAGEIPYTALGSDLRVLGTGGLSRPSENPGSYAWMALADPLTRQGIVAGWLTFERGSGVVFAHETNSSCRLEARIEYGQLHVAPGATEALETLALGYFDDARLGLEAWADAVARANHVHLRPQPTGYCTWYSRPHGGASDEKHLAELTGFAAQHLAPFGFSVVQIDDGWQAGISTNGPKRNFTTHSANGPYPSGMKAAADQIKAHGLVPGLWFMPFAGTYYDPFFADHADWFVRRTSGEPYETAWGGTSLDLTQPAVQEYLRGNIQRIVQDWGFQYLKMDGLWTGSATRQVYVNDAYRDDGIGDAVFHDPDKSNIEVYRSGLRLARAAAGPDVFLLGCCSPQNMRSYGGAFGCVDAMRIGPDNGAKWQDLLRGPTYGSRQYFLHGRVWYNDPDPVYVRASVPLNEAQLICSWVAISGQLYLSSEWYPTLPPERLDILKRSMPSHGLLPHPVDLFENGLPRIWLLSDTRRAPRRDVLALYNWDDHESMIKAAWNRLGLETNANYIAFDYWSNSLVQLGPSQIELAVPPHSCRILALRPAAEHPQLLSTSRHVTQGMVDVRDETWIEAERILSGTSQLVANDPYELRILLPQPAQPFANVQSVQVTAADSGAGVRFDPPRREDSLLRVTFHSPVSRQVQWSVKW